MIAKALINLHISLMLWQRTLNWNTSLAQMLIILSLVISCSGLYINETYSSAYSSPYYPGMPYCDAFQANITNTTVPVPVTFSNGTVLDETQSDCVKFYSYQIQATDINKTIMIELNHLAPTGSRNFYPVLAYSIGTLPRIYYDFGWDTTWGKYDENGK